MKIESIKTTIVSIPTHVPPIEKKPVSNFRTVVLVQIRTDEGIVGLGESVCPIGAEPTKAIIDSTEPLLRGQDPTEPERLKKLLYGQFNLTHLHIHAACWALNSIDMALWDIVGKVSGQPLYKLWGGAFRKRIPFYGYVYFGSPDEVAAQARGRVAEGFTTVFLKIGFREEEDIASLAAIRDAVGPGIKIRADANQSWTPEQAIRMVRKLAPFDLEMIDQPTLMYNVPELARIRAASEIPIASHESSWTMYDAVNVIRQSAADVIHVDPRFDAGMMGARITAGISEAAGLPVVMHAFGELGVAQCANMHLIASAPNFTMANQSGYNKLTDDVIVGGQMAVRGGCIELPEGPGIGVELDHDKVEKYARCYEENVKGREFAAPSSSPSYMLMQYRSFFQESTGTA